MQRAACRVLLLILFSSPQFAWAQGPASDAADFKGISPALHQLQRQLADLHIWLGPEANGRQWRSFLKSDELAQAMAFRDRANPADVAEVLAVYDSGAAGLDKPPFVAARAALAAWHAELQAAEAARPARAKLGELARSAKSQFKPVNAASVAEAKQRVVEAAAALDAYLAPNPANAAAWKKYLLWAPLAEQLQAEQPDLQAFAATYRQLTGEAPGLERAPFRQLAQALRHYGDLAPLAGQEGLEKWYGEQLDKLAGALDSYDAQPTAESRDMIGESVGRFASLGLAPELIEAVQYRYSYPNFWGEFSDELVAAGFRNAINRPVQVQDNILGTRIVGEGTMNGALDLRLTPNFRRAHLETIMNGVTSTRTRGYNGPVVIHNVGNTALAARKWIFVEPSGVWSPAATAAATTASRTTGIDAGLLARQIASNRVAESRGQANAIAAQHAEARLQRSFDAEASEMLAKANSSFQEKFRAPLLRKDEFPQWLSFTTDYDHVAVAALQANRGQLGAPTAPPAIEGDFAASVRIFESAPNNAAEALLGGRTLHSEEVKERIIQARGSLPKELEAGDDEEPWSITFARRAPITAQFGEGQMIATIRGQRYTSGDREFGAMNVEATYKIAATDTGLQLERQGELNIAPPNFDPKTGRLSAGEVALRRILQRKFQRLFPETVVPQGIDLPGRWASAGRLEPKLMQSGAGWLSIGWALAPAKPQPAVDATAAVETK